MPPNHHKNAPGPPRPSQTRRDTNAAMAHVMQAWEALDDLQRLVWETYGSNRRRKGIDCFKQINLRRLGRGDAPATEPPGSKLHDTRPLLKALDIRNRDGRIALKLQLWRAPDSPRTVWASLPCNRGRQKPHGCPRLGWLPAPRGRWCDITDLYFRKHGQPIFARGLPMVGKRIFVRLRIEDDDGATLYEQAKAVVPLPEVALDEKPLRTPKAHRRITEAQPRAH